MDFTALSLNDLITITVIIAQAGVVYYRLKKVEQRAEHFNDLIIEFAVHKNLLKYHRNEFEKQSARIERIIQRLEDRLLSIESRAYKTFIKNSRVPHDR